MSQSRQWIQCLRTMKRNSHPSRRYDRLTGCRSFLSTLETKAGIVTGGDSTGIDTYMLEIPELKAGDTFITKVKQEKSKGLPIIHHHGFVSSLPPNHRFAMRKFHGVMKFLRKDNIVSMKQVVTPEPLSEEAATVAHDKEYVHRFWHGLTSKKEQRKTGFLWNEGLLGRCRLEAGGTLLGSHLALQYGMASSTGGGTHHAHAAYGSGFCLLNDLAIAARALLASKQVQRILIIDLDVHQGDGTAAILQEDENIFTLSVHCQSNFPFVKQQSDLDLSLPDHTGDEQYMRLLSDHLSPVLDAFRPELVLYDAGVDPHVRDDLGKLDLTDNGLYRRDLLVFDTCARRGIACMSVIGGGYCRDIHELSLRHTIVHRAATKVWERNNPVQVDVC